MSALLTVRNLTKEFESRRGLLQKPRIVRAVDDVSFDAPVVFFVAFRSAFAVFTSAFASLASVFASLTDLPCDAFG